MAFGLSPTNQNKGVDMPRIDTEINGEIVSVELDDVWRETFAHWDSLVNADTASAIATATERILVARRLI